MEIGRANELLDGIINGMGSGRIEVVIEQLHDRQVTAGTPLFTRLLRYRVTWLRWLEQTLLIHLDWTSLLTRVIVTFYASTPIRPAACAIADRHCAYLAFLA